MEVMIILFVAIAVIGSMAFWVWSLVDILRSNFKKESDKIIWLVVVLTLHHHCKIIHGRNILNWPCEKESLDKLHLQQGG